MLKLSLKDCLTESPKDISYKNASSYVKAIDALNKQFDDKKINCISIGRYRQQEIQGHLIEYEITRYTTLHTNCVPDNCRFTASYYVGCCSIEGVRIIVSPRFGDKMFSYLLSYTSNVYLPLGQGGFANSRHNNYWIIGLLWKSMLNKALTEGQIPKTYVDTTENQKHFRGKLNIARYIRKNLTDQSKFFCHYRKLSLDNTINRAIRYTYSILNRMGMSSIISEFGAYDERLFSLGVSDSPVSVKEIDSIHYTRINAPYRPIMNVCRAIISCQGKKDGDGASDNFSYFVNIADLWELYVLRVLQRNLPSEYNAYSPNSTHGDYLLEDDMREIRPDIIIEKDGTPVMIIDAKYKQYTNIGRTALNGISRDDLYQMNTYMYHYGHDQPMIGIFTSPVPNEEQKLHTYSCNKNHKIGIVNLCIDNICEDVLKIHDEEQLYVNKIMKLLRH